MDHIVVKGAGPLQGHITISGAKNAALPLMAAALLTDEPVHLNNVPHLADIDSMALLLEQLGCDISFVDHVMHIHAATIHNTTAPYDLVRRMRASALVLGPLVARYGHARVSLPGGCAIGGRPLDIHMNGLRLMGADIELHEGYIDAKAPQGLTGTTIAMPLVSVMATENLMMAACLAKGTTTLVNAAREPEIVDLANCLKAMGGVITGAGTDHIIIEGQQTLRGTTHTVIPDRIETGTYAVAALITGGSLTLNRTDINLIPTARAVLEKAGGVITPFDSEKGSGFHIERTCDTITEVDIMTEPYPGFPTDLQAQLMALMTLSKGAAMITETIFENRFMHVPELCRMGAHITVHGSSALVRGVPHLSGAEVMATDIRASVSLILAGLVAKGTTKVHRIYHLDRGYDNIVEKLQHCGAVIERVKGTNVALIKKTDAKI